MKLRLKDEFRKFISLLLVLTMTFVVYGPVVSSADSGLVQKGDTIEVTGPGSITLTKTLTNDGTWSNRDCTTNNWGVTLKNNTGKAITYGIKWKIEGDFDNNYTYPEVPNGTSGKFNSAQTEYSGGYDKTMNADAEPQYLGFRFRSVFKGSYKITMTITAKVNLPVSYTKDKAITIRPEQVVYGNGDYVGNGHWYKFTLSEDSALRYHSENVGSLTVESEDVGREELEKQGQIIYLKKGNYLIRVGGNGDLTKDYTFHFDVEKYNYGYTSIKWDNDSNKLASGVTKKYTVTFKKGKNFGVYNKAYLYSVNSNTVKGTTYKGSIRKKTPGYYYVIVRRKSDDNLDLTRTTKFKYSVKPKKLRTPRGCEIKGGKDYIRVEVPCNSENGKYVSLQKYSKGKWTTVTTKKVSTEYPKLYAKKLHSRTRYKFRLICRTSRSDKKPAIYSSPSKTFTLQTAPSATKIISSVKISNVKVTHYPKKYIKGYRDTLGRWHSGHYENAHYSTKYTITVKLKKPVKGSYGLIIDDKKVSGKGTVFKLTRTHYGNMKGKKVTVSIHTYGNYSTIRGPLIKKTVKVK